MHVGIVGYGVVGRAIRRFLARSPTLCVSVYDRFLTDYASYEDLVSVDTADIAFVAVPTPYDKLSGSCDLSAVEETVGALSVPLCIKSTVPPGTTDGLIGRTGKHIAYSPEYAGESPGHPWPEIDDCGFLVVGGDELAGALVRQVYETAARPGFEYLFTSALTAELGKYMENAYLASKVAFVNQFYDLASASNVNFDDLRKMFLLDSRVGESHTLVTPERGFGGKCLPKDLRAIVAWAKQSRAPAPLLEAILAYNDEIRAVKT
jgi:UDPglucose 6-dehydrogenase